MLKDCIKLIEVDQSIGELKTLNFLSLKDCKSLMKLPRTIGLLVSLEVLILSGCSRLDDVPMELQNIKTLRVLKLDETAIHQSKSWISWLSLKRSKELDFFWASLPSSLVKFGLESCRLSDDVMPSDLSSLSSLKSLNLSRNPFCSLPESIKSLTKLDELLLISCTKLQVILKLPILSNFIEVYTSMSPITIVLSTLPCLFSSKRCVIFGCKRLIEVQDVFKLEPIGNFEAEEIKSLFNVDSIDSNKEIKQGYFSSSIGIPETNNNTMLWLIHWPTKGLQLQGGDFVSCKIVAFDLNIREFGITCEPENNIIYEYDFLDYCPGNEDVTRNMELEITEDFLNLESYENVKVQICNCSEESKMVDSPVQVLYDRGIITAFDSITDVPFDYYRHRDGRVDELEAGDHISLKVLSNLCVRESGIDLVYDYKPDDKCNSLDQFGWMSKCSSFLSGAFVYLLFKSQITMYRMHNLVKE
ncbi:hypothetical protein CRYUN_Cryun15aG0052400 [Craigia yunnanensis]